MKCMVSCCRNNRWYVQGKSFSRLQLKRLKRKNQMEKAKLDIVGLFANIKNRGDCVKISAPMVRYSKLEFRSLLRKYNVDLCFTPMIIADSFCQSSEARQNELTTNEGDSPLIVQFAAKNATDLLTATEMIYPYADGVDLNCGCPQRWAITAGYGCALLKQPELLHDMIQTIRRNISCKFSISTKMRILEKDLLTTVELARRLEKCGATFISIHGRRPWQKSSEQVDVDALVELKKSLQIPFVVNGDIKTVKQADEIHTTIACDGIMVARGLLSNPTMFSGTNCTTLECIQRWVNLAYASGDKITFQCFHHHLTFMMEKLICKRLRVEFNNFTKKSEIFQFLDDIFLIKPQSKADFYKNLVCTYDDLIYKYRTGINCNEISYEQFKSAYIKNGTYFKEFQQFTESNDSDDHEHLDFMGTSIFKE